MPSDKKQSASNKPIRQANLTTQSRRSHVNAFELGAQTMTSYCKTHSIPISTFSAWVTKYGKKQKSAFAPVQVKSSQSQMLIAKQHKERSRQVIEIHRGNLRIMIPTMLNTSITIEIIKGMIECN